MKRLTTALLLFALAVSNVFATTLPEYRRGAAELGIGGTTSLYGYNSSATMYNPALLNRAKFRLDLFSIGIGYDQQIANLVKYIKDHNKEFNNFDSLSSNPDTNRMLQQQFLNSMEKYDDMWFKLGIAPQIGFTIKHFGFVMSDQTYPEVKLDRGIFNPMAAVRGYTDLAFYGGYGDEYTLPLFGKDRTIEYGVTAKILTRREVPLKRISATKLQSNTDLLDQVKNDFNKKKTGFGIDIGLAHNMSDRWELGAVMHDAIGTFDGHYVTPNLVFGTKYSLKELLLPDDEIVKRWIVTGEIQDWFNGGGTSFFYKWHMGTEIDILNRFALRGGFNQGYPTAGVGLDLWILKLDYAYYGEELGLAPGQLPSYKQFAQISVGW